MNAIVPRATIHEIEAHRAHALSLYAEAFDALALAGRTAALAAPSGHWSLPSLTLPGQQWRSSRDEFLTGVRQIVDRGIWEHLLLSTGLERLMDRQEREAFREQVKADPPEATADNCFSTMERLVGDADLIFKRGIANAFSKLDRRFRSHDGFKIGSRLVLSYAFDSYGSWSRHHDETMRDVERTFYVLDGKEQPDRSAGIVGAIDTERRAGPCLERHAFEAESDYFRIRAFKNGNAHVWFKRDDLLDRVNLLLADYYGASLGAAPDVAEKRHGPSTAVAKNFGFFETPDAIAERVIEAAHIYRPRDGQVFRVLEPNVGTGRLALKAKALGAWVMGVEIQPHLAAGMIGRLDRIVQGDFLEQTPAGLGLFDRIVMNPPFDRGLDVEHVRHAIDFLAPGGRLAAIMSAGVEFREDRRTADFRALVERYGGQFRDLPPGSFAEAGTNVNTVIVSLRRDA